MRTANYKVRAAMAEKISHIAGAADVHVHQVVASPELELDVDRIKASQLGLTQRDVTNSMLISLSGSSTVAPNFWLNWANGVNYNVGVQTPQYRINSMDTLLRTPISPLSSVETVGGALALPLVPLPAERPRHMAIRALWPAVRNCSRTWCGYSV